MSAAQPARPPAPEPAGVLVVLCDIPFFPGKMGLDFFNLRQLARSRHVGVVGPRYEELPAAGVANLRASVQACYFWPERLPTLPADARPEGGRAAARLLRPLPPALKRRLLHALVGLHPDDHNGLLKLAILSNLSPYLLKALHDRDWQALVVIQSDTRAWLDYLPPHLPLAVYFHDVRSDYLERRARFEPGGRAQRRQVRLAARQEREICLRSDAVGFVSELDRARAERLGALPQASVAEIPLDLDYYRQRPPAAPGPGRRVLFTGLLAHPPNVDAALYFLNEVWPHVRRDHADAVFQLAGAFPSPELAAACRDRPGVELHANVPDIRPFFQAAAVFVVPMRFGGGVRQKILEAWAMEVPVVLTSMAAEGSGALDGVNALIADSASGLARRVSELLHRPRAAAPLVRAGRRHVEERHALAEATPQFERLVDRAVAARRAQPFRALLDLSWLWPARETPPAPAARALLQALAGLDARNRYRLLAPGATLAGLRLPRAFQFRALPTDGWSQRLRAWRSGLANRLAAQLGTHQPASHGLLRLGALSRLDCDLVHLFQGAPASDLELLPHVRSLHAVLSPGAGLAGDPQAEEHERRACARAALVLCPSEVTRRALQERWGLAPDKLRVVPPAPEGSAPLPPEPAARLTLARQMGLPEAYLLVWPDGPSRLPLVEGLERALPELPRQLGVVILADAWPAGVRPEAVSARARLVLPPARLSLRQRRVLLGGAQLVLRASGPADFDLPLVEALWAGAPLLLADEPLARELGGEAAGYAAPEEPEAWARGLMELATDATRREALARAAPAHAARFSWAEHARATVSAYQDVHAGGPPCARTEET